MRRFFLNSHFFKKNKNKYLFIFILLTLLGMLINTFYRPFINNNNIYDFGLADIGNNILFIPASYYLILYIYKKPIFSYNVDIVFHLTVLIIIELLSKYLTFIGTYDFYDIIALTIGALITFKLNLLFTINCN